MQTLGSPALNKLASLITEDPFCGQEGVKVWQTTVHTYRLRRIRGDLQLHVERQHLPYTVVGDLRMKNILLQKGVAPDLLLLPGWRDQVSKDIRYPDLVVDAAPDLVLEVVAEKTYP